MTNDVIELYELTFANGKRYIGISACAKKRLAGHMRTARNGAEFPISRAIRKHGAPSMNVLCIGDKNYIAAMEEKAIKTLDTQVPNGYNLTSGGEISPMLNPEAQAKNSASQRARNEDPSYRALNSERQKLARLNPDVRARDVAHGMKMRGTKASAETKAKMSAARLGRKQTAEHTKNLSESRMGGKRSDESKARMSTGQKLRVRTPEEIARMSVIAKLRKMTPEYRTKLSEGAKRRWAKSKQQLESSSDK